MCRTAVRDGELQGKTVQKGERVVLWFVSGNYDEVVIELPVKVTRFQS